MTVVRDPSASGTVTRLTDGMPVNDSELPPSCAAGQREGRAAGVGGWRPPAPAGCHRPSRRLRRWILRRAGRPRGLPRSRRRPRSTGRGSGTADRGCRGCRAGIRCRLRGPGPAPRPPRRPLTAATSTSAAANRSGVSRRRRTVALMPVRTGFARKGAAPRCCRRAGRSRRHPRPASAAMRRRALPPGRPQQHAEEEPAEIDADQRVDGEHEGEDPVEDALGRCDDRQHAQHHHEERDQGRLESFEADLHVDVAEVELAGEEHLDARQHRQQPAP